MTTRSKCTGAGGRGCGCPFHTHRRVYHRAYAGAKRRRELEQLQLRSQRCPRRAGPGVCGGILETFIESGTGRTRVRCPLCERRRRGVCRDCNAPVYGMVGRAIRCERHAEEARRQAIRASEARHHDERIAKSRAYYRNNEAVRQRRNEYKRAWRKANPDKVRLQKKRYVERHRANPHSRYNRYHARYRKKFLHHRREVERDRLRATPAPRKTSPKCTRCGKSTRWKPLPRGHSGRPWTVCTKCLFPCERRVRLRNRRRQLQRAKEWEASIPAPARIKRPPRAPQYGPAKERLCLGGCGRVLTHRRKKCTKCRDADRAAAELALVPGRGRGHRTDREAAA